MTDRLPGARDRKVTPAAKPRPVDYAAPSPEAGSTRLSSMGFACSISFLPACFAAALLHPKIPEVLLGSLVGLPLAGFVLGLVARHKGPYADGKSRWRAKSAVVIGGVELGLVLILGLLLPQLCRAREPAKRVMCASNLRQIGMAMLQYSNDHGGQLPPTLLALLADPRADITAHILVCPSSADSAAFGTIEHQVHALQTEPGHMSYVYVGNGLSSDKATVATVLAYDNPHNHGDEGINVLYGDGHVDFLDRKRADRMKAELKAGHNPPRAP